MINQRKAVSTVASLNRPRQGNSRWTNPKRLGLRQTHANYGETDTVEPDRPRPLLTKTQNHRVFDPNAGKFVVSPRFAGPLNIDQCDKDTAIFHWVNGPDGQPVIQQFQRKPTVKPMAVELPAKAKRVPPVPKRKQRTMSITKAPTTRAESKQFRPLSAAAERFINQMGR